MSRTKSIYKKIDALRERYYSVISGKQELLNLIDETEIADHVYNSNAIENSTLTFEETEKILLQIDLDRYISEREMFEARNLARVVSYIHKRAKEQELTFEVILMLHKMLIANIRDDIAGRFRGEKEWVRVGNYIAVNPKEIPDRLEKMMAEYNADSRKSIVQRIAKLHLTFEYIHPFNDGNGRIGRVINNYLLMREGFVPINIKFIDRSMYYDAFRDFQANGSVEIMEEIVAKALTSSYHKRLAYLENKKIVSLKEFAKEQNVSLSSVINKAKRQTIEAFLEKGSWKIGV